MSTPLPPSLAVEVHHESCTKVIDTAAITLNDIHSQSDTPCYTKSRFFYVYCYISGVSRGYVLRVLEHPPKPEECNQ